jgi:hypothetical protein
MRVRPSFYLGTRGHGHGNRGGLHGGRPPCHQNTSNYNVPRQHTTAYGNDQRGQDHGHHQGGPTDDNCNWYGIAGHCLRDCPDFTHELRRRAVTRKGQLVVNAAVTGDSSDEIDSNLDEFKDKLGLPYLPNNLVADLIEFNLAEPKLTKRAPWILDSGASTSVTDDVNAIKNL